MKDCFKKAMNYHSYWLTNRSWNYDGKVAKHVAKWASGFRSIKKSQLFDPMDTISVMGFLHAFNMDCDTNQVHEGAAMWLDPLLYEKDSSPCPPNHAISCNRNRREGASKRVC